MPKETAKTKKRQARARRTIVALRRQPMGERLSEWLQSPPLGWGILIGIVFILGCSSLVVWTRSSPTVSVGRIMDQTRTVRFAFSTDDIEATERARDVARAAASPVYISNPDVLSAIRGDLENLPGAIAGVEDLESIPDELRAAFRLTEPGLEAVRTAAESEASLTAWQQGVADLMQQLRSKPLLSAQDWERATREGGHEFIQLRYAPEGAGPSPDPFSTPRGSEVSTENPEQLAQAMRELVRGQATFAGPAAQRVVNRLIESPRPTFRFDSAATAAAQNDAANAIETITREIPRGTVVFARGDQLTPTQYELYRAELATYADLASAARIWLRRLGLLGAVMIVTLTVGAYAALFVPRLARNPGRVAGLACVLAGGLLLACITTIAAPEAAAVTTTLPVVIATGLLALAYDRRAALAFGGALAVLTALALDFTSGRLALTLFAAAVIAWRLDDVRARNAVVSAGAWTGLALALGIIGAGAIERPLAPGVWVELGIDALLAGLGGVLVGACLLAGLPWIERAFGITTPLTLIDLRDSKQPLLKELQRRAPGTYNHSLNVASIAEAAVDAIGGDTLLTYVGGLYHDIGKMNKPEYFVENQSGGPNKHDKLAPAMSLLVIIGHVKDGMEMARAYGLPRPLHHFIEGHHGSTLVEYFFHRAKTKAQADADETGSESADMPAELEYRYPGPRPRTKEVAILMLADAVESATRAMPDPTSSRIDQLVRDMARKRLLDRQFDDSDLTFRELTLAVEAISKTVASLYHGRIAYPAGDKPKTDKADKGEQATKPESDEGGEQKRA